MTVLSELRQGRLAGLRRLDLSCGLGSFPPEIFDLAESLEVLDLSGNALQTLPDDLPRLHRLRVLFCSNNAFTELPEVLGRCPSLETIGFRANRITHVPAAALPPALRALILTDNRIDTLPPTLAACTRLQKLMLAGNRLQALPADMADCARLELLRLSANRFTALPGWLADLPRLSWLASAGNPMSDGPGPAGTAARMNEVDWHALQMHEVLGKGASGVIHRASWTRGTAAPLPVAAKLFKSALTSDGLPRSEMAACLAAGDHPNLIGTLGRITGHPQQGDGLVMRLVPPAFTVLAGPPSLDTCTRDVYGDDLRLTLPAVLRLAVAVASAAAHLHRLGLLHGDLYAHNILRNQAGDAVLGDLGAATFLPAGDAAAGLQRLEVRAFGCLLEELRQRCDDARALPALAELQARCLHEHVAGRPLFDEVLAQLIEMQALSAG